MKKLLLFLIATVLLSCQTEEFLNDDVEENLSDDPKLTGSRLSFTSKEHLNYFVNHSKTKNLTELKSKIALYEKAGFRSLLPTFDSNDITRVAEYKKAKTRQFGGRASDTMDGDEDEIIADPNFALVVNDDRELIVNNNLYKFTEYAVFFTEVSNESEIQRYVKAIENCELILSTSGVQNVGNKVYAFIPDPVSDICEYEFDDGNDGAEQVVSPNSQSLTREQYIAQMKTCDYQENLFDRLFGPSQKCISKFENDRRIKTRAWNQNFLIYSSVGIRTKTQKRTLGIWWASDSDEIELGYEVVKYRYDGINMSGILKQIRANSLGQNYVYSYKNYLINQFGVVSTNNKWGSGSNLFERWPIEDGDTRVLKIYLGDNIENWLRKIDSGITTFDGKEFNNAAKALAKQAWDAVRSALKDQSADGATVIVGGNPDKQKFYFVYCNWRNNNKNDNKISKVFDFNTGQIGFSLNPGTGSTNWSLESTAKSYKEFSVSCYGVARRGNTWKGGKIVLAQNN